MTLDEAIKHAEEVVEEKENEGKMLCSSEAGSLGCLKCAEEHRQLTEWLKDYKRLLEQESKTGHWIDCSNGWMCSECNRDNTYDTNYCPNCGAKMIEPKESEG